MKRILAFILAAIMCLSLVACGAKEPPMSPEEKKALALDTLSAYVLENGVSGGGTNKVVIVDTGITDVIGAFWCNENELYFKLDYSPAILNTNSLDTTYSTVLYFYGAPMQKDDQYFVLQWNSINDINLYAYLDVVPDTFTANSPLNFSQVIRADGAIISANEEITRLTRDGTNVILEVLSTYLDETIGFTLSDFGFTAYEIDSSRDSGMRSGKWS